jgi:hypothetical protein
MTKGILILLEYSLIYGLGTGQKPPDKKPPIMK